MKCNDEKIVNKNDSPWRIRLVLIGMFCCGIVLIARLAQIQWIGADDFHQRAEKQSLYKQAVVARPGDIVDRHGRLLATSITTYSLYVVPRQMKSPAEVAAAIANVLSFDADALNQTFRKHDKKHFLWVRRRLTSEQASRIRAFKLPKDVWGFREEFLRSYPQGNLAAHLLGTRNVDGQGAGGIEEMYNEVIRGGDGHRIVRRDAHGRIIDMHDQLETPPEHGETVVLAIDSVMQLYAELALDSVMQQWSPKNCCALVLDPNSGEVLVSASRPTYDPNKPVNVTGDAWKDQTISSIYEPGSTLKPLIVAWAMEQGKLNKKEILHCEQGSYRMGKRLLHDNHPYGELSLTDILVKSSNIGMAKIGERLGNREIHNALRQFHFGRTTGCGLPGELTGIVRPLEKWDLYSTGSVPMGQEIAVTPLQLITAHAALANGGKIVTPRHVLRTSEPIKYLLEDFTATESGPDSQFENTRVTFSVVQEDIARWIIAGPLIEVVKRGTGKQARLYDYEVFGKTGTSQKIDPRTGRYSANKSVCSFVCGAPGHQPRLLVLVVVDEPTAGEHHSGGSVAAPAAAEILQKCLTHLKVSTLAKRLTAPPAR